MYVPRLALLPPGASFRLGLATLAVTPVCAVTVFAAFEVRPPLAVWLAAGTRTATVGRPRKSPAKDSASVAVVPSLVAPATCAMERFGMADVETSSNAPVPAAGSEGGVAQRHRRRGAVQVRLRQRRRGRDDDAQVVVVHRHFEVVDGEGRGVAGGVAVEEDAVA